MSHRENVRFVRRPRDLIEYLSQITVRFFFCLLFAIFANARFRAKYIYLLFRSTDGRPYDICVYNIRTITNVVFGPMTHFRTVRRRASALGRTYNNIISAPTDSRRVNIL